MDSAIWRAAQARNVHPYNLDMNRVTPRELAEIWPVRVVIRKDWDGKWAATWPSDIVRAGWSAGAGRHETITALVEAIEAKGYEVERATRRSLLVRPVLESSWIIDGFTIEGVTVVGG